MAVSSATSLPAATANAATPTASATAAADNGLSGLGEGDFLKLLVTQLQNQDPLNPVDDTTFTQQLTQFSTLDAVTKMNSSLTDMLLLQGLTQGTSLIGKTITYSVGTPPQSQKGSVSSVSLQNGSVQLMVNGNAVDLSQVQSVGG